MIRSLRLVLVILAFLALAGGIYLMFDRGFLRFNYPTRTEFPIWGIDVSHHQGKIDWSAIKKQDFQFAYIKATEGGTFRDSRFRANWEGARRAGLKVGAYHFFTLCRPVQDQIANFTSVVPVESDALPPALDLEFGGNCGARPAPETLLADISAFSAALREKYGADPVFYVTDEFYDAYLRDRLKSSNFWIRSIFGRPKIPGEKTWKIWQFANRGRVQGIAYPVDLNVLNGSLKNFF